MNHLELTIADLRAARNRADMLINGLLEFQAGCDGNATEPTAVAPVAPPEQSKTVVPQGTAKQGKPHKNAPKGATTCQELFTVAARLKEPFSAQDLATAADITMKQAQNFLVLRVSKAEFDRVDRGQYQRGRNFPGRDKAKTQKFPKVAAAPIKVRKLGERPGLVPMARGDARPTISATPTPAALASVSSMIDKPTTLGAAMKVFIRTLTEFTGEQLRQALQADKDIASLIEESYSTFANNLMYWAKQGFLSKDGDGALEAVFTVTKAGKEWFAK